MLKLRYTTVSNPRATASDPDCERQVDCDVVFPRIGAGPVAFTAVIDDPGSEHGREIFSRVKAGEFGPIAPYEGEE